MNRPARTTAPATAFLLQIFASATVLAIARAATGVAGSSRLELAAAVAGLVVSAVLWIPLSID